MPGLPELVKVIRAEIANAISKTSGQFVVATVTPDFTVYLDGSANAVPGAKHADSTYSVGTTGMYLHRQGQKPLCFPTA